MNNKKLNCFLIYDYYIKNYNNNEQIKEKVNIEIYKLCFYDNARQISFISST